MALQALLLALRVNRGVVAVCTTRILTVGSLLL
jgi:hypothetical protein